MRFIVYRHTIDLGGREIRKCFIALANDDDEIIGWTDFAKYCWGPHSIKNVASDDKCRIDAACRFLNYAFFTVGIHQLSDVTPEIIHDYLNDYGTRKLPSDTAQTHRTQNTIERE